MDDSGHRENGRHKQDQYKGLHSQWLIPTHMMKDQYGLSIKFMTIMTERDTALQERDLALSDKRAALAERDTAILQRDAAINERNTALMERDNAIAAYEHQENAKMNCSGSPTSQSKFGCSRGTKHMYHHPQHGHHPSHSAEAPCHTREMHIVDAIPISVSASQVKPQRDKRTKETKVVEVKKNFKPLKKFKKGGEDLNRQIIVAKPYEWKTEHGGCGEDLNKDAAFSTSEWKDQDLGLNQVVFDDSTMPIPVCSCTGTIQQCYKWGNGGWQSACCTTTLSMYPLPMMPNRRHARVGGRKMSGSAFTKLLSRLAAQGRDLSAPLDLKEHWAKHGTNRYITIK